MNYNEAAEMMKTARNGRRKLENNTYLYKRGENYAVCLHGTDVVTIHNDGMYTLNNGGWQTVTSKDRINAYSSARIYQEKGVWYFYLGKGLNNKIPFENFTRVDHNGNPCLDQNGRPLMYAANGKPIVETPKAKKRSKVA